MIVPRHRIDELRAVHDRLLTLPIVASEAYIALADLVARAIVLCRPITAAELEPGHMLALSARADLERALDRMRAASAVLGAAGTGDSHEAATHALNRLTLAVDKVVTGDLTMPFRWELDMIVQIAADLGARVDQGRLALESVLTSIDGSYSLDYYDPREFERARSAAAVAVVDCLTAYEMFDRAAARAVTEVDARAAFAIFQGGHDPLDPLAVLVR